jgi:hypothetical protein
VRACSRVEPVASWVSRRHIASVADGRFPLARMNPHSQGVSNSRFAPAWICPYFTSGQPVRRDLNADHF